MGGKTTTSSGEVDSQENTGNDKGEGRSAQQYSSGNGVHDETIGG